MELEKAYQPLAFDSHRAQWWIKPGIFHADAKAPGPRLACPSHGFPR